MYKKMLIPLDGSALAESVLPYAIQLAGRLDIDMVFLRVYSGEPTHYPSDCYDYLESTKERVKKAASEIQIQTGALATIGTGILVTPGYPAEEILKVARDQNVDLIMMATHGYSGVRAWAIGSVADKVLRKSTVPVFLVRAGMEPLESNESWVSKTLLVPLDGSKSAETALLHVKTLAKQRSDVKINVKLLRIVEVLWATEDFPEAGITISVENLRHARRLLVQQSEDYISRIQRQLESEGVQVTTEVHAGEAASTIIEIANRDHPGLIVMTTYGWSGEAGWGLTGEAGWDLGSDVNKVIHSVKCPVLLVRPG